MRLSIIFIGLLFIVSTGEAGLYKWVDENGVTHYSNTPVIKESDKDVKVYTESGDANQPIKKQPLPKKQVNQQFTFDGFNWNILDTYKFSKIGRSSNLKYPKKDYFFVIEAELTNISNIPRYYGRFKLLQGDNQYEELVRVRVYAEYQFDYKCKDSTQYEPGARMKTYFGFDVKAADNYTLIIQGRKDRSIRKKIIVR